MDNEAASIPDDPESWDDPWLRPGSPWNKPGPRLNPAVEAFLESQRKLEDKLRNRFSKKNPDLSYHELEAVVSMKMLEMSESEPDKFFAALSGPEGENREPDPQPADAVDPTLLTFLVQWKV